MGAEFTRVHAKRYTAPKGAALMSETRHNKGPVDPIQIGVRRSPLSAILLAYQPTGFVYALDVPLSSLTMMG
jgi:hypothetical protein